jgi:hypothetical protein
VEEVLGLIEHGAGRRLEDLFSRPTVVFSSWKVGRRRLNLATRFLVFSIPARLTP